MAQILTKPDGIQTHLIHADEADGGKVVAEASQIPFGIRIQSLLQKPGDHISLDIQGTGCNVHHVIQTAVEIRFDPGQISDTRHIDGDNAYASGALSGTEETAGLFPEFPKIQSHTAAHAPHIAGLHITVDIV